MRDIDMSPWRAPQFRRLIAASATALLAIGLSACGSGAAPDAGSGGPTGDPVRGGSFTYLAFSESAGLDPVKMRFGAQSGDTDQGSAIFDTLMYTDSSGKVVMKTAESLTSSDGVHWVLTLRKGITFTDGTPYDAAAVKFNWERMAAPSSGAPNAAGMANVAAMAVTDSQTLSITLAQPYTQFPQTVSRYLSMIGSPKAIQELGQAFATKPVGAGPFLVESWTRDSELRLVRNPDYWQKELPYLDSVTIRQVPDDEQRLNTFIGGQGDAGTAGPNTLLGQRAADAGAQLYRKSYGGGINLVLNTRAAPFDDPQVRKAVALAVDLEQLNQIINQGTGTVPATMFNEGTPFYAPDIRFQSAVQDKEEAQRLFNEYAARTGGPVRFTLISTTVVQQSFELIQAQLRAYDNVEIEFQAIQNTALAPTLASHEFQAVNFAAYADDFEPALYSQYHSEGKQNWSGVSDAELDKALDDGRLAQDSAARKAAYATAQDRLVEIIPDVFIQRYNFTYFFSPKVGGFQAPSSGVRWEELWLAK